VSAPEGRSAAVLDEARTPAPAGLLLSVCATDIVELAAYRGCAEALRSAAGAQGLELPHIGGVTIGRDHLALSVRPDRWLVLSAAGTPGESALHWQKLIGPAGAAIDQTCGMELLHLEGTATGEVLARGCRLDLDPAVRAAAQAAATIMAQVPVILGALSHGLLLLTPSSTAQHLREWLAHTAHHDGFQLGPARTGRDHRRRRRRRQRAVPPGQDRLEGRIAAGEE
jgi:sarcosine oxidase subunit gamma